MSKQLAFLLFICTIIQTQAQEKRVIISGRIISDSQSAENIHIHNKNSKKGAVSYSQGEFSIPVKENDTLVFSGIQFYKKEIRITKEVIENKIISVKLFQKINELDEVEIDKSVNMAIALKLPNANKKPLNKLDGRLNYYSQQSVPIVILASLLGQQGGIEDLYNIISGNRKKDRKLKGLIDQDKLNVYNQEMIVRIRFYFEDDFFIHTLKIPTESINEFIEFCIKRDIINLFNKERILEVTDTLIVESKSFLKIIKSYD